MKYNIIKTVLIETLNRCCALAMVLLVSRNYSIGSYGNFTLFVSITSIGQTIIDFGSQNYGVKELVKSPQSSHGTIIKEVTSFRCFGFILWVGISIIYAVLLKGDILICFLFLLWGIIYIFYPDWILKGTNRISTQASLNLIANVTALGCFWIIIQYKQVLGDFFLINLTKLAPLLLAVVMSTWIVRKGNNITFFSFEFSTRKFYSNEFKESFFFTLGSFYARAYNSIGLILLGFLANGLILGSVSYAFTFYNIFSMGRGILISSIYPYFCKMSKRKALKLTLYLNFSAFIFFCILFLVYYHFKNQIIYLIVPKNIQLSDVIIFNFNVGLLLICVVCISFFSMTFLQVFVGGKIFNKLMFFGLIIVFSLNVIAYFVGLIAYSTISSLCIAEIIIACYSYYKIFKIRNENTS